MNVDISDDVFKNRIIDYVDRNFLSIIEESFQKKDWKNSNGFAREELINYIKKYIVSDEYKSIINNFINENILSIVNEIVISEIKRQSKETIKYLIQEALTKIDIKGE